MFVTKPHSDMGIFVALYINVTILCNLVIRYTFDKLIPKLTEYTSYEVNKTVEVVVPTTIKLGDSV